MVQFIYILCEQCIWEYIITKKKIWTCISVSVSKDVFLKSHIICRIEQGVEDNVGKYRHTSADDVFLLVGQQLLYSTSLTKHVGFNETQSRKFLYIYVVIQQCCCQRKKVDAMVRMWFRKCWLKSRCELYECRVTKSRWEKQRKVIETVNLLVFKKQRQLLPGYGELHKFSKVFCQSALINL